MEILSVRLRPINSDTDKIVSIGDDVEYRDLGEIKKGKITGFDCYGNEDIWFKVEGRGGNFFIRKILP